MDARHASSDEMMIDLTSGAGVQQCDHDLQLLRMIYKQFQEHNWHTIPLGYILPESVWQVSRLLS